MFNITQSHAQWTYCNVQYVPGHDWKTPWMTTHWVNNTNCIDSRERATWGGPGSVFALFYRLRPPIEGSSAPSAWVLVAGGRRAALTWNVTWRSGAPLQTQTARDRIQLPHTFTRWAMGMQRRSWRTATHSIGPLRLFFLYSPLKKTLVQTLQSSWMCTFFCGKLFFLLQLWL